jgi:phosphatidate cytidylyltransferase
MTTLAKRILLTLLGIPIFLGSIFFFPGANFLVFILICLIFSILGSYESAAMLEESSGTPVLLHPILVGLIPVSAYLELHVIGIPYLVEVSYLFFGLLIGSIEIFKGAGHQFKNSISSMAHSVLHLIYPSALTIYVIRMTSFDQAAVLIIFFFFMIFSNDVFAYVFGMLLGSSTRGAVAVSPKKSTIGFLGGFASALLFGYLLYLIFPGLQHTGEVWQYLVLSAITALTADAGDLAESVFKRSADIKDSGTIIPGRGGILDTIDSIVFSAPVFYFASILLLKVHL